MQRVNTVEQIRNKAYALQQGSSPLVSQENRSIWSAFGSYVAKELVNGRGVMVPKFGNFTFSAAELDLQGTTNPDKRDKQIRTPVFMVSKDFVSLVTLRSGIVHTSASGICSVRPLELKGASGVVPKVKINYVEVASLCGKSKEVCREVCELVVKYLSDQTRNGSQVQIDIPQVGRFMVRNSVAAVSFTRDLHDQCRGATARTFTVNNLFGSANATLNQSMHTHIVKKGTIQVSDGASTWLKKEMGINLDDLRHSI